jgi:hypothetical protein
MLPEPMWPGDIKAHGKNLPWKVMEIASLTDVGKRLSRSLVPIFQLLKAQIRKLFPSTSGY